MLKKIGKEWGNKTHLSPSQINKLLCQWHYDYNVLTVHKITVKEVMEGKK